MTTATLNVSVIKSQIPDFAKDIKINFGRLLGEDPIEGLSEVQRWGVALACAQATQHKDLIAAVAESASNVLSESDVHASKAAAAIMAMNNVYYRSMGMLSDPGYAQLRPGLRMQVIGNPGVAQVDFELYSLAVSAINGCHHCVESHAAIIEQNGVSKEGVQSAIKIAAVLQAVAHCLSV